MIKYVSIDDIVNDSKYPFTKGQLRHHVAKRKSNGLASSIRKIGRRIYIREDLFIDWLENHAEPDIRIVSAPKDSILLKDKDNIFPLFIPKNQNVRDLKINELDFSVRTMNRLQELNITTFEDLLKTTKSELIKAKNMGKKSIREIEEKVKELGCVLKE